MQQNNIDLLRLIERYRTIHDIFVECYQEISELRDNVKAQKYDLNELVNRIYITRECSRYLDDLRKEMDGISTLMQQLCCAKYTLDNANAPHEADSIRASFATGTPKTRMQGKVPKLRTDPKRYFALMRYFGIPEEVAEKEILRIYWPSFCEYISELAEQGKPLPDGIGADMTYPVYSVNIYVRRPLDEVIDELDENEDEEEIEKILTQSAHERMQYVQQKRQQS